MTAHAHGDAEPPDRLRRKIGWGLGAAMLLSFMGGVVAFMPAEHRARKLQEMKLRYAAKYSHRLRAAPPPQARPRS